MMKLVWQQMFWKAGSSVDVAPTSTPQDTRPDYFGWL
jgi:hypothetical protein